MSRSGYTDDGWEDGWSTIRWRGAVKSALRGKRGQSFLMEMLAALDALPLKRLVVEELVGADAVSISHWGEHEVESVCAIGAVGRRRGVDMSAMDPEDHASVAFEFGIAQAMAQEIVYVNDEDVYYRNETPEDRFARVRRWVVSQIEGEVQ